MSKLTKAQTRALTMALDGGVFAPTWDKSWMTIDKLRRLGLLSSERDELGYYSITDAGRAALASLPTAGDGKGGVE